MTLNIVVVARALGYAWMSYRGPHMLNDSLPEDSHQKCSHIALLDKN